MHEDLIPARQQRIAGAFVRATMFRRRHARGWDVPTHLAHEVFTLPGNNGGRLPARWFPAKDAQATVVLCHPDRRYGQHWWVRVGWVEDLLAAGCNVLTFDFTQYGGSKGGSTYLYQDVIHAVEEGRRRSGGLPLHVFGVSLGAFAAAVASPWLDIDGLVLESPYPDFGSWYEDATGQTAWTGRLAMGLFGRLFPQTDALIRADQRIGEAQAPSILIAATKDDEVTAEPLTHRVAARAPVDRTTYLTFSGVPHLGLRDIAAYRRAVLERFV